jgi:YesN/AraC family two-component response regulator
LIGKYQTFIKQDIPDSFTLKKSTLSANEHRLLVKALDYIEQNSSEPLGVSDICRYCSCSVSALNHIFKKNVGINIKGYINKLRIKRAKMFLQKTNKSITEIAFTAGFSDSNYFTKVFKRMTHSTPKEYRKRVSMKVLPFHHL